MMQFRKINLVTGLFEEDALLDTHPVLEDGSPDPTYVAVPVPPGFVWPRWNGEKWAEGGTPPVPVTPEPTPEERLAALEAAMLDLVLGGV